MNTVLHYAIALILYPGGFFALLAGWLWCWFSEQVGARWRGTRGTRLMQPVQDCFKLLRKTTNLPIGAEAGVRLVLFVNAVATLLVLVLLPLPGNLAADSLTTSGDLLAVLFLLLLPTLTPIFLGNLLASPYGRIEASRAVRRVGVTTALLLLGILAIVAQRGSLSLNLLTIQQTHPSVASILVDALAGLIFLLCLPALLPVASWGPSRGEPLLVAGIATDLTGADLALLHLGAALQPIAAGSLLAGLFILPFVPGGLPQIIVYLATLLLGSVFVGLVSRAKAGYSFAR
ncbi:MAG TPA: NADH-quinone oxidoreductase subunit H [Ktedonobacterales bacterium]|nr:NADH-quinone oxidoreductase subunit H [Ktedonobacterales bacterium]